VVERGVAPTRTAPKRRTSEPVAPTPATRVVFRHLLMQGMSTAEAASLTAFMCGLPATDLRWSLKQLNQLLFLRSLHETGRLGASDGSRSSPD
jgi:hypothetical protein